MTRDVLAAFTPNHPWDELRAVEEAQRLVFRKLLDFVYCDHTQETRADSQALVEILGVYAHLYHRMTILREECLR